MPSSPPRSPLSFVNSLIRCGALLVAFAAGCDTAVEALGPGQWPTADGGTASSDDGGGAGGLPCDVQKVLSDRCTSCHGATLAGGAPISLATRADLMKPSYIDAKQTFAQRSVTRMKAAMGPMPPAPAPAATAGEIMTLQAWIDAGMPAGMCDSKDPFAVPPQCTSGTKWTRGNDESPDMNPGQACIDCHTREGEGPVLAIGGTVYATGHEPNNCNGGVPPMGPGGAVVVITGKDGREFRATVRASGNFFLETRRLPAQLVLPYTAKVVWDGRERPMNTPQMNGDCNACHTQDGKDGAPGRVVLP